MKATLATESVSLKGYDYVEESNVCLCRFELSDVGSERRHRRSRGILAL